MLTSSVAAVFLLNWVSFDILLWISSILCLGNNLILYSMTWSGWVICVFQLSDELQVFFSHRPPGAGTSFTKWEETFSSHLYLISESCQSRGGSQLQECWLIRLSDWRSAVWSWSCWRLDFITFDQIKKVFIFFCFCWHQLNLFKTGLLLLINAMWPVFPVIPAAVPPAHSIRRMEWRRQSSLSCADAFIEAQRWIQVTFHHFLWVVCSLSLVLRRKLAWGRFWLEVCAVCCADRK